MTLERVPAYRQYPGATIRRRLVEALREELLGPESREEILQQSPATRYLVGMLAPHNTPSDPSEDDSGDSTGDADGGDQQAPVSLSLAQSSIGLSFVLEHGVDEIEITAEWGEYSKVERPIEVSAEDSTSIDRDDEPEPAGSTRRKEYEWRRSNRRFVETLRISSDGRGVPVPLAPSARLEFLVRSLGARRVVSVFLVNALAAPAGKRPPDELWLYQPRLEIRGKGTPFLARAVDRDKPDPDGDIASADLVYRKRVEFATGHGVATNWEADSASSDRAVAVWTEVVPEHEVPVVSAWTPPGLPALDMMSFAEARNPSAVADLIEPLLRSYSAWIHDLGAEATSLGPSYRPVAEDHVDAARRCQERLEGGLRLLSENPNAFEAFRFANRAMALQREATERVLALRRGEAVPVSIPVLWRPFQIGFILQCLRGLAEPDSADRDMADLLWFPTGGGKTEAYLGLTAFTLAYRRLRQDTDALDCFHGTSVLMRYTLRLLTIQQFQRATALICACDVIRQDDIAQWGTEPFTIGLWVGASVTPATYDDAKAALKTLKDGGTVVEGSPYQVLFCPWCGTDLDANHYSSDDDLERTLIKCSNRECTFSTTKSELGLPVLLVDQEIYRQPPSLVLATVDKFAQMAWNGRIQSLFGRVTQYCERHGFISAGEQHSQRHGETRGWPAVAVRGVQRQLAPPDLIIQDELHLISGPLGTVVGIYESAVEGLCTRLVSGKSVRPKVVASTATIRRASHQVQALFDRDVAIFPPQGLDASDTFFAKQDDVTPGRLYVGVYAPGKSVKTSLVRVYAAMLSRALLEFEASPTSEADAYMTLVGYFNSLKELGGANRLVDDDVPKRLRVLKRRGFGPNRLLYEKKELTSRRRSQEIAATLKDLDKTFVGRQARAYPVDLLLASNMLSVGVDINRLGLMVVSAQPKTSAEYIQATSRVGRRHPGLVIEVYNWVRPRDTSHYERFSHYHDTFYRHVEATSVTPFSARARDRALAGVLVSYLRLDDPKLATEQAANLLDPTEKQIERVIGELVERAYRITGRQEVRVEIEQQLRNLIAAWHQTTSPPADRPLVYSGRGLRREDVSKSILMRQMEQEGGRGMWKVAGSLREVEPEIDVVLIQ